MKLKPFWQRVPLQEMSKDQWESLCDGCGLCCLIKLQEEGSEDVAYTELSCQYLDLDTCRCKDYENRAKLVAECALLSVENVDAFHWLPESCAYRRIALGQDLPLWHYLISGDKNLVHSEGHSAMGYAKSHESVAEEDYEDHILFWVDGPETETSTSDKT
jgi:uncharacterized cysteine cluster protein YcgN (CxxCxxCC family)